MVCCSGVGLMLRFLLPKEFSLLNKARFSLLDGLFLVVLIPQNLFYLRVPVRISAWLMFGSCGVVVKFVVWVHAFFCRGRNWRAFDGHSSDHHLPWHGSSSAGSRVVLWKRACGSAELRPARGVFKGGTLQHEPAVTPQDSFVRKLTLAFSLLRYLIRLDILVIRITLTVPGWHFLDCLGPLSASSSVFHVLN